MEKTTRLTQQDLQIYPSQRMTDTPDGGGLMVGQPLTGEDNEIFPPVSDVDRTMGSLDARLLYPAVLRNDSEPLYGGHFVITEPPTSENVSFLAFKARNYGESRADIMPRIEAYSVPTVESRMTLLGRHLAGVRLVQAYQRVEAPLPKVGESYCLQYEEKTKDVTRRITEYFRIINIEDEVRIFEIPKSNGEVEEVSRRVVKMEISNPLTRDFDGVDYPVKGYAAPKVKILETQVADSAAYYGVKPVSDGLSAGDATLTVSSIYEKLVPTSTVETPYADEYPVPGEAWVAAAPEKQLFSGRVSNGTLIFPCSLLPGSVKIGNYQDNALGQLKSGDNLISVDYAQGRLSGLPDGYHTVTAIPAANSSAARYAFAVEIKETNHGTSFAPLLKPTPVLGSLKVSFMALGVWYLLSDSGDGILRDEAGKAVGTVSSATGSIVLNLPVLPDVGSRLVFQWGGISGFASFDGGKTGVVATPKPSESKCTYDLGHPIKPGTLVLTWTDNGVKTARDDGNGNLTGDIQGAVDYLNGVITTVRYINSNAVDYTCEETLKISASVVGGAGYGMTLGDKGTHFELMFKDSLPNQATFSLKLEGSVSEKNEYTVPNWYGAAFRETF